MDREMQKYLASKEARVIFDYLVQYGLKCFQLLPGVRVIWLPWEEKAYSLDEPKVISHLLVMMQLMNSYIAPRNRVVEYFILLCERNIIRLELTDELLKRFPPPQTVHSSGFIEWANRLLRRHPEAQQKKTE